MIFMNHAMLADRLLPDVTQTPEDILKVYPKRQLPPAARVTRFAPSPTGFLHIGGLYAALASERLAHQSSGVFFLRIEDTDQIREIKGSIPEIIESLLYFGIRFDEGEMSPGYETGSYGPYRQSARKHIYRVFVKHLLRQGLAYPCFCTGEELSAVREKQTALQQLTGYYGQWAIHRDMDPEAAAAELDSGKPFVVRLKSPGNPANRFAYHDMVKGTVEFPENVQDIVLLKSDGLPTYHFAHAVDDFLMGTTHVFRADEWLSSIPVHLQLFQVLGWNPPAYAHISPIMKMDGTSKRKYSKRKDADAAAAWYRKQGYPGAAVTEYLLSLLNSNYEEWRIRNPEESNTRFEVTVEKMSSSGALFDAAKFNDICKDAIARFTAAEVYDAVLQWSFGHDAELNSLMTRHREYTLKIFDIGRGMDKPRKDIAKWSDVKCSYSYFYDELFQQDTDSQQLPQGFDTVTAGDIINFYRKVYKQGDDKTAWFEKLKDTAEAFGCAREMKDFRKDPSRFKGHIGDIAMLLRIAVTNRTTTPDLYDILQVMGEERVLQRLKTYSESREKEY
jgi:glutamyl-tRNA synthetase